MKREQKLNLKKILTPLFLIICIIIVIFLFNSTFKKAEETQEDPGPIYAKVQSAQDGIIDDNTPLSNILNNNGKTFIKATYTYSTFLTSRIEENNVYITLDSLAKNIILYDDMSIEPNTEYAVSGTKNIDIKEVFIGHFNTVTDYPVIFILYKDGSAQYVDAKNSFYNASFEVAGNINVKNIEKFETVNITDENNLTTIGVIAINSQNVAYEITKDDLNR